jgi:hypothetical protein
VLMGCVETPALEQSPAFFTTEFFEPASLNCSAKCLVSGHRLFDTDPRVFF